MNDSDKGREIASADREAQQALETASKLVRVEFNLDSQPIWAPSSCANELKRSYPLPWRGERASVTVQSSGEYGMLRGFDKLILATLVKLWNQQSRPENGRVYFRIGDILDILGLTEGGKNYRRVKDSLHRLRGCLVQYQFSFFDQNSQEYLSLRDKTILSDLLIVEPRAENGIIQNSFEGMTFAVLDFSVVANLLGNFTRPVSLRLLQSLSEKGLLFESYINAVLFRRNVVRKDVFELWHDLGLSTRGIQYGSQLASRMRKDLDKICGQKGSWLGKYDFEKSKTRARSMNLVLHRAKSAELAVPSGNYRMSDNPRERYDQGKKADVDRLVEWMRFELHDESTNDTNLRIIAGRMPENLVRENVYRAFAYYRDGQTRNPTAYFVGIMKKIAKERGIDLGLPQSKPTKGQSNKVGKQKPAPKPINQTRREGGIQSIADIASQWGLDQSKQND